MIVWAHVRQCDPSLRFNWRDDQPQVVRALLRDLLHDALALIVLQPYFTNPGASDEVKEQVFQKRHELFQHTHDDFLKLGHPEGKQLVAARAPNCITRRVIT